MKKRMLACLLASMMLLSAVACGTGDDTPETKAPDASTDAATEAATEAETIYKTSRGN